MVVKDVRDTAKLVDVLKSDRFRLPQDLESGRGHTLLLVNYWLLHHDWGWKVSELLMWLTRLPQLAGRGH